MTNFALLGRMFYNEALPEPQKSLVDDEISKGLLNLYNDDDPVKTVLVMVNIVAVDGSLAQVSRLISTYQSVVSCTRKKDERLSIFASRFRGLASKHLRHCGVSPSSQTGQVLAITLLNNARLEELTLTNAKMQLIALAEERAKKEKEDKEKIGKLVPVSVIKPALEQAHDLMTRIEKEADEENDDDDEDDTFFEDARMGSEQLHKLLDDVVDSSNAEPAEDITLEEMFKDKSQVIKLHLDDAVTVLRNISQGSSSKQTFNLAEVQTMLAEQVQSEVKSFLASHNKGTALADAPPLGSSSYRGSAGGNKKRKDPPSGNRSGEVSKKRPFDSGNKGQPKRKKRLTDWIPDAEEHCGDCGSKTHKRGSDECKKMSWATKKIREAKERENNESDGGFRGGSSR